MSAWLALVRLQLTRLAELPALRAARLYAIGMSLTFGLLAGFAADGSLANHWLVEALTAASWAVAGLSALGIARDLERRDRDDGVSALGELRGFARSELELARSAAAMIWIAVAVALPAWLVLGVSALVAHPSLAWTAFWAAFVGAYALALALALSVLARAARALVRGDARLVVVLAVLGPELLRLAGALPIPTLPRAFAAALSSAEALGKALV